MKIYNWCVFINQLNLAWYLWPNVHVTILYILHLKSLVLSEHRIFVNNLLLNAAVT